MGLGNQGANNIFKEKYYFILFLYTLSMFFFLVSYTQMFRQQTVNFGV